MIRTSPKNKKKLLSSPLILYQQKHFISNLSFSEHFLIPRRLLGLLLHIYETRTTNTSEVRCDDHPGELRVFSATSQADGTRREQKPKQRAETDTNTASANIPL